MTVTAQCDLFLPVPSAAALHGADFPALRALLRPARLLQREAMTAPVWLCRRFGVAPQQDMPSAPYAALGDGLPAQEGYWLHADPVALLLQRDGFVLAEAAATLQLSRSRRLAETLNRHFADCGMHFYVAAPRRWYLRLTLPPALQTCEIARVLGRNIRDFLPGGADGLHWHRRLNELQMLLHEHPVNVELEAEGMPAVNSVWLWGGGSLAALPAHDLRVWADDALPRGLALASGCALYGLPRTAEDWLAQAGGGAHHVVLPAWSAAICREWLAPLQDAVRRGRIELTLHLAGERIGSHALARRDFLKFWRRPRPLEAYLG